MEVVASVIYMKDPFLCLKRGNKGPIANLKEDQREKAQLQATEAKEGEQEEGPLVRKERKEATPRKRSKPTMTLRLVPKGQRYASSTNACSFLSSLGACAKTGFAFYKGEGLSTPVPEPAFLSQRSAILHQSVRHRSKRATDRALQRRRLKHRSPYRSYGTMKS